MNDNLSKMIFNSFLLFSSSLIIVLTGFYFYLSYVTIEKETYNNFSNIANNQMIFINRWFEQHLNTVKYFAGNEKLDNPDIFKVTRELIKMTATDGDYFAILKIDRNGRITANSYGDGIDLNVSDRSYFQYGKWGEQHISEVITTRTTKTSVIAFSQPIIRNGEFDGVLVAMVNTSKIKDMLERVALGETGECYLVDQNMFMISKKILPGKIPTVNPDAPLKVYTTATRKALRGESGTGEYLNYAGKRVYGTYRYIPVARMALLVEREKQEIMGKIIDQIYLSLVISTTLVFILALQAGRFLSRRLALPLEQIGQAAKEITKGNLGYCIHVKGNKEVMELADIFNEMSERLLAKEEEINCYIEELTAQKEELEETKAELLKANKNLEKLSVTDELTGLYNRRYLMEAISMEVTRSLRYGLPMSVIMLDLDRFKKINDTYGHTAGDQVLREIAVLLNNHKRASDILSRYGGEEFVILSPMTDLKGALVLAEKIRGKVEQLVINTDTNQLKVTISAGVTELMESEQMMEVHEVCNNILNRADNAMYRAKQNGRNQVEAV